MASPPASELLYADSRLKFEEPAAVGEVERPMALESLEAAAAAGTAGMSDTPPSEEASPCVVIMLASDVKLWAVEPACVANEHRSSAGPLAAAAAAPRGRPDADPPLVMLLVSFAAAPRLPVLLMWLIEPVGGREMSAGPLLGPTLSDAAPVSVPMLLVE
jgi:hypothetical protein